MKNLKDQLEEQKEKAKTLSNAEKLKKSIEQKLKHVNKPIKK